MGLSRSARMTRAARFGRSLSLPPLSFALQKWMASPTDN
jgi:hypothetical protein